ncbi:uncharacterized protein LOC124156464 [Ischnura elegans]|uniref:uncharacterized protein LOC124156464 n=1 Tax=Ischnura elegans TaxID=197161 RepID=UPI001ED8833A|nr:uncharacterized protein LOC124156464 [Ischnura elegans]
MGPVRSVVQQYFIKLNSEVSVCEFCQKEIKTCGNTTNLRLHLIRKHRDNPDLAEFVAQFPIPPSKRAQQNAIAKDGGTVDQTRVSMEQTGSQQHQATMQPPQPMKPAGLKKFFMRKSQEQNNATMYSDRIQTIKEEDEFDYVGKNVSAKLRSLPRDQRIFAEKLVNDILFEAELGNLNRGCTLITNTEKNPCYPSVSYISPSVEMHSNPTESPDMAMNSQMNNTEQDHGYLPPDDKNQIVR